MIIIIMNIFLLLNNFSFSQLITTGVCNAVMIFVCLHHSLIINDDDSDDDLESLNWFKIIIMIFDQRRMKI